MQGAVDIQIADLLDIRPVVVHHEQLQRRGGVALGRGEAVAVTGEDQSTAGQRTRSEIVNPGWVQARQHYPGVGRERLRGELHDLSGRDVDPEQISTLGDQQVGTWLPRVPNTGIVHRATVEGDERIRDRIVTGSHQDFLTAVRMQQHQVRTRFAAQRAEHFRPGNRPIVAVARRTDVDNVIVVLHAAIFSDRSRPHVEDSRWLLRRGNERTEDQDETTSQERNSLSTQFSPPRTVRHDRAEAAMPASDWTRAIVQA